MFARGHDRTRTIADGAPGALARQDGRDARRSTFVPGQVRIRACSTRACSYQGMPSGMPSACIMSAPLGARFWALEFHHRLRTSSSTGMHVGCATIRSDEVRSRATNDQRPAANDQRPATNFLPHDRRAFQRPTGVVAQRHIHKDFSAGSIEAHHHRFGVFTAFAALLGSVQGWGTNMKVKSLVVERGDSVANDLIGQLTDRFAY